MLCHLGLIIAAVIAVNTLKDRETTTYVVNLVPAIPAIGSPRGESPKPAPLPPRPEPTPPAKTEPPPTKSELPPAPRDLPPRDLPPRQSSTPTVLPDRPLPPRPPVAVAPRTNQKELPTVATAPTPSEAPPAPPSPTPAAPAAAAPPPPPPTPAGQPTGSPQGAGKITLDVDFPYAWYLRAIVNKINEKWEGKALPGQQPQMFFEIDRSGQLNPGKVRVEKSSGNPRYDQMALRAILEASPFPRLPDDFKASLLTVHLQFNYRPGG
jgi:TonB family protein